jgi:hypothetical protein
MANNLLSADEIRKIVLAEVKGFADRSPRDRAVPPREVIANACARAETGGRGPGDARVLESFFALFNEGILCWGLDRSNVTMGHSHVTPLGETVLRDLDRDPANPSGFLAEVRPWIEPDAIAWGYVAEAVHSYNAGCDRGAAVLLGCAAEALVLDVRDALVVRLESRSAKVPKALMDWKAKPVIDEIDRIVRGGATKLPHDLAERVDAHWRALFHHVRMARNEAGHPASVRPVERTAVHGNLLLFPALARLARDLREWIGNSFEP